MKKVHNLATVSPGKLEFGVGSTKLTKPYIHTIEVTHMAAKGSQRVQDPATVHNLCNVSNWWIWKSENTNLAYKKMSSWDFGQE